ncbi:MAG: hypothetical protein FJ149_07510 [Euryarchaeota archaeon]|nr:hypothetical protein [Euryarchaeota archaeon]
MAGVGIRTVVGALALSALVFNSYYAYVVLGGNGAAGGWLGGSNGVGEDDLGDLTVKVPESRLYDLITYDYHVFAELYGKNLSSGEWEDYTLIIDGQMRRSYPALVDALDGFNVPHACVEFDTDTTATFTIYVNASDAEPLQIGGNLEAKRKEYIELNTRRLIDAYTEASVGIDRLPRYNVPLNFEGWIDAFADPNREPVDTVDENIFGEGQTIQRGQNGTFVISQDYGNYGFTMGTRYNWTASAAQRVADLKALRINITGTLFGAGAGEQNEDWFTFNETVWISKDCSFPVKRYSLTDIYSEDQDRQNNTHVSRTVFEITNTLKKGGFTRGTGAIPWGDPSATVFEERHPMGEFTGWQYAPTNGAGVQGSSFTFGVEEAVAEALRNSTGLQGFVNSYNRPGRNCVVDGAGYNFTPDPTDIAGQAGVYRWNLSFAVMPDRAEQDAARQSNQWDFRYSIVVVDNVTWSVERLQKVYRHRVYIENDWGLQRGYGTFNREFLAAEGVTLASSEQILLLNQRVKDGVTNPRTGDIDWKESTYFLGAAGMGSATPGLSMLQTLTGLTFPSVDFAWGVQTQTVYESGSTFGAALDVETGQLVYVMSIQGTALLGIFG